MGTARATLAVPAERQQAKTKPRSGQPDRRAVQKALLNVPHKCAIDVTLEYGRIACLNGHLLRHL